MQKFSGNGFVYLAIISVCILNSITSKNCFAEIATEKSVVLQSLRSNRDIILTNHTAVRDSLTNIEASKVWMPSANLDFEHMYVFLDSSAIIHNSGTIHSQFAVEATQYVPMGGAVIVRLSQNIDSKRADDRYLSPLYSGTLSLSFSQPLLTNAWAYGASDEQQRIASWNYEIARINRSKVLIASISEIRRKFWDYFLKLKSLALKERDIAYLQRSADYAREKFKLGAVAELDTLSAVFLLITAEQNLELATIEKNASKRSLALALGADPDTLLEIDTTSIFDSTHIESFSACSLQAVTNDFDLQRLNILTKKYEYMYRAQKNGLLPDVNVFAEASQKSMGSNWDELASRNVTVGIKAHYPIPVNSTRQLLMRSNLDVADNVLENQKRLLVLNRLIRETYDNLISSLKSRDLAIIAEKIAQKKLDAVLAAYRLGTKNTLELESAHNDFLLVSHQCVARYTDVKLREIELDELTGTTGQKIGVTLP